MSFPGVQPGILPLLYQQHTHYVTELGHTHQALSKLYKKLARVERVLTERQERELCRSDKKKWQYSRSLSKRGVANLELKQASLHDHLRQCNDLIASYEQSAYSIPVTPWTAYVPLSPYLFSPYSAVAATPWSAPFHRSSASAGSHAETQPQYWDLSMLHERRSSDSPLGSTATADSGFNEPQIHGLDAGAELFDSADHVYAHEMMSPVVYSPYAREFIMPDRSHNSSRSEQKDEVRELRVPASPSTQVGAQSATSSSHKRCYSANAIQIIESHLAAAKEHARGMSAGAVSRRRSAPNNKGSSKEAEPTTETA